MILSSLGLATFSPARKDLFLGAHEATSQGVTHPGIAPASNSLNFGVLTTPQPPARFCSWELTKQLPRVVTHPGIAPASHSLNFGVLTTPKPVSSQKASSKSEWRSGLAQLYPTRYCPLWAGLTPATRTDLFLGAHGVTSQGVTHPGIAPASNSLNFGVLTTPQPVSPQKASC
ncbi:hypothetical protein L3X38_008383 [Prunus dulcis]|uniref:Uncharacterized protein n=1 Tax=Prunus dulcis TaxID=3755 RepID=A0AAD5F726_PRUDU|nr:hypothetical protein L3X38_008383 [Prunus dulcis]